MAQMGIALAAMHLGTAHEQTAIIAFAHHVIVQRRVETGPATARFELGARIKQGRIATDTAIGAGAIGKTAMAIGALGRMFAGDLKRQLTQLRQPFGVCLYHLVHYAVPLCGLPSACHACVAGLVRANLGRSKRNSKAEEKDKAVRLETGRYLARLAEGPTDIARAQELRHFCFLATRGLCRPGGRDADAFDAHCQHVLIEDIASHHLLACFRAQILPSAQMNSSYAGQFYDLQPLESLPALTMELGRFCSHPDVQSPEVLRLAWAAITRLAEDNAVGFLFGCTSFAGADPALHAEALAYLGRHHLAPHNLRPGCKSRRIAAFPDHTPQPARALAGLPPLLRSYLGMGGWVSDHAVIDPDLDTLHVFTGLEVARIPPARARALRALAG